MPTYEYECQKCARVIERFQAMTEKPLKACPHCGGGLRRLISAGAGVIFKGSGFYQTDYRSESYKKREKEETDRAKSPKADTKSCGSGSCSAS
jgi:putative FmdB family regulatory protein